MRHCNQCGSEMAADDLFCGVCGTRQEREPDQPGQSSATGSADTRPANSCPKCGCAVEPDMRFCQNCGSPLPAVSMASGADTADNAEDTERPRHSDAAMQPPTRPDMPLTPAMPASLSPETQIETQRDATNSQGDGGVQGQRSGAHGRWLSVLGAVVALALIATGVWWFALRPRAASRAGAGRNTSVTQRQGPLSKKSPQDSGGKTSSTRTCSTPPSADLVSTDHDGDMLVATFDVDTGCDSGSAQFSRSNVRVTITNDNGVVAAAVFDFAQHPIAFVHGHATVKMAYGLSQYWIPYDQLDSSSDGKVLFQAGEQGNGDPLSAPKGDYAGSNVRDSDIERYAQTALTAQISHDTSQALDLEDDVYTSQLSSKKYGLQAEGKVWHYRDIYEQFLQMRLKHGNALLVWAADHNNYAKDGNAADYYVVLSGERFASVDDANGWCSSNGYNSQNCVPVQLQ